MKLGKSSIEKNLSGVRVSNLLKRIKGKRYGATEPVREAQNIAMESASLSVKKITGF